jgi:hypothetical protein
VYLFDGLGAGFGEDFENGKVCSACPVFKDIKLSGIAVVFGFLPRQSFPASSPAWKETRKQQSRLITLVAGVFAVLVWGKIFLALEMPWVKFVERRHVAKIDRFM